MRDYIYLVSAALLLVAAHWLLNSVGDFVRSIPNRIYDRFFAVSDTEPPATPTAGLPHDDATPIQPR